MKRKLTERIVLSDMNRIHGSDIGHVIHMVKTILPNRVGGFSEHFVPYSQITNVVLSGHDEGNIRLANRQCGFTYENYATIIKIRLCVGLSFRENKNSRKLQKVD